MSALETTGVAAASGAVTLALTKTIDHLARKLPTANGNGNGCKAPYVDDRLREYHLENRALLQDIRDGIRKLIILQGGSDGRD